MKSSHMTYRVYQRDQVAAVLGGILRCSAAPCVNVKRGEARVISGAVGGARARGRVGQVWGVFLWGKVRLLDAT